MPNFKFVKAQFKNVWFIVLIFFLIFTLFVVLGTIFPTFSNSWVLNVQGELVFNAPGAVEFFNAYIFGILSFCLFWSLSVSLSTILLNKDISRGYIASWLTTPMSRTTIFNSKLFVLLASTLGINLWMLILEMICYSIAMSDFNQVAGRLALGSLALMCFSLLVMGITWMIFCVFKKNGVAMGVELGIFAWFGFCLIMSEAISLLPGLDNLKYFKYFNIVSLFNSPLTYQDSDTLILLPGKEIFIRTLTPLNALDFAWQLPVMVIGGGGLLIGAQFIIKNKDFAF